MGYDVTYHPISPEQMRLWYVTSLGSDAHAELICDQAGIQDLYKQKFLEYLPEFRANTEDGTESFDKTHAFYLAVTQGFFAKYHYVRGAMLSQLGDVIAPYTEPWTQVLPELVGDMPCENRIVENYSGGVYVPPAQVERLLEDRHTDPALQAALERVFPGEHLGILLTALHDANEVGLGLLEATDLIEPNPLDLQSTHCLSNLFNCDTAGPLLYQRTAQAQLAALEVANGGTLESVERIHVTTNPETGEVTVNPSPVRTGPDEEPAPEAGSKTTGFRARFRRGK